MKLSLDADNEPLCEILAQPRVTGTRITFREASVPWLVAAVTGPPLQTSERNKEIPSRNSCTVTYESRGFGREDRVRAGLSVIRMSLLHSQGRGDEWGACGSSWCPNRHPSFSDSRRRDGLVVAGGHCRRRSRCGLQNRECKWRASLERLQFREFFNDRGALWTSGLARHLRTSPPSWPASGARGQDAGLQHRAALPDRTIGRRVLATPVAEA